MRFLIVRAFVRLILFDLYLLWGNFDVLYEKVRRYPCAKEIASTDALQQVCAAIDMACIWYWKEVLCLQRSAATTCLLRKYGVKAEMIIGTQQMPFKSHAWVELGGKIVNDKPYLYEMYAVIDRC